MKGKVQKTRCVYIGIEAHKRLMRLAKSKGNRRTLKGQIEFLIDQECDQREHKQKASAA